MRALDPRLIRRARSARVLLAADSAIGLATAVLVLAQATLLARIVARAFEGASLADVRVDIALLVAAFAARGRPVLIDREPAVADPDDPAPPPCAPFAIALEDVRARYGPEERPAHDGVSLRLELSGGQRQRLVFARALLADAPVLVLDEPTAHLDPPTAEKLMEDVVSGAGERSVLLITHRPEGLGLVDEIVTLSAAA